MEDGPPRDTEGDRSAVHIDGADPATLCRALTLHCNRLPLIDS